MPAGLQLPFGIGGLVSSKLSPLVSSMFAQSGPTLNNYAISVGDSISVAGGDLSGTVRTMNTSGNVGSFFTWGALKSQGKLVWGGVSAASGANVSTIIGTYWPTARDATPRRGIVVFMAGTNDLGSMRDGSGNPIQAQIDTRIATIEGAVNEAISLNMFPVVCAIPPTSTALNQATVLAYNTSQQAMMAGKRGLYVDTYTPVGNGSGAWSDGGYTTDGTHPSRTGAPLMGQALSDALTPLLLSGTPQLVSNGDETTGWVYQLGTFQSDANVNGRPAGGGNTSDDYWGVPSNTATLAIPSGASDGVSGNWLQMDKTGSATASSASLGAGAAPQAVPVTTTPSNAYLLGWKLKTDWSDPDGAWQLEFYNPLNASQRLFLATFYGDGVSAFPVLTFSGLFVLTSAFTNTIGRFSYQLVARGATDGLTGDNFLGQLSMKDLGAA